MKLYDKVGTLLCLVLLTIAVSIGCRSAPLEPGGAYSPATTSVTIDSNSTLQTNVVLTAAPNKALFQLDSSFKLAYTAADTAFTLERDNRALLWGISPKIKRTLDKYRPQAVDVVKRYALFRQQYLASPTPEGLSALETVLYEMQHLSSAVQAALPQQGTKK